MISPAASIFIALVIPGFSGLISAAVTDTSRTLSCQEYTGGNTTSATCNRVPGRTCSKGCTNGLVAQSCFLKEGDTPSQQTCSIAYGRSSAVIGICINEQGSYSCNGTTSGQATCSGCVDTNPDFMVPQTNTTSNTTSTAAATTTTPTPDAPSTNPAIITSTVIASAAAQTPVSGSTGQATAGQTSDSSPSTGDTTLNNSGMSSFGIEGQTYMVLALSTLGFLTL